MSALLKLLLGILVAYVFLLGFVWVVQDRLVFPSPRRPLPEPRIMGFEEGRRVSVAAPDGVHLNGWYLPPNDSSNGASPGLLWFYGNMETVGTLSPMLHHVKPAEFGLLILDYRGYGENDGSANERAVKKDGEAALSFLADQPGIDRERIAVYGRSIGSAVAMHLASTNALLAVILDSPVSSATDMAHEHYRFVPPFMVRMKLNNVALARRVDAPILILHGSEDWIAPSWMGERIAEAASNATYVELEGVGHNTTYTSDPSRYRDLVWSFLRSQLAQHSG